MILEFIIIYKTQAFFYFYWSPENYSVDQKRIFQKHFLYSDFGCSETQRQRLKFSGCFFASLVFLDFFKI